jgi:MarR family transcriptional regulator, transcriptional regulator for hemolysin
MSDALLTAPQTDLMFLLSWASHVLAVEQAAGLAEVGITARAYCVLVKAATADLTQGQLTEMCDIDRTTMVATVDELEQAGLAERRRSASDRRAFIIHVTPAGMDMLATASQVVTRIQSEVLSTLPARQREGLIEGLSALVAGRLSTLPQHDRAPRRRRTPPVKMPAS